MTTILALDLGTITGFAFSGADGVFGSGQWDMRPKRHASLGARCNDFKRRLGELHAATPIHELWYEAVDFHTTTYGAQVYGSLLGILQGFAEEREIPYQGVQVAKIKKFATGKGNAPKMWMIAAARKLGYEVPERNDNEADALCLLHFALAEGLFK